MSTTILLIVALSCIFEELQPSLRTCYAARTLPSLAMVEELNVSSPTMSFQQFLKLAKDAQSDLEFQSALKRVFNSMSSSGDVLTKGDFIKGLAIGDYRELIGELWDSIYGMISCARKCERVARGNVDKLSRPDYIHSLASIGGCWTRCFQVPQSFDWSKSTTENYALPSGTVGDFVGEHVEIRALRNLSFHANYGNKRQFWQDAWIHRVVNRAPPHQEQPWLIYTAGGMGVGKGWVMKWLTDKGYLGMESITYINPDYFKSVMPEYKAYQRRHLEEGTMCHQESGYMQEIALWAALHRGSHILEDGSLRDEGWYAGGEYFYGIIPYIRQRFPRYRVAILHIDLFFDTKADKDAEILRRLKAREQSGERSTPEKKALASYAASAATVNRLVKDGLADLVFQIDNTKNEPELRNIADHKGWRNPSTVAHNDWSLVAEQIGGKALAKRPALTQEEAARYIRTSTPIVENNWDTLVPTLAI